MNAQKWMTTWGAWLVVLPLAFVATGEEVLLSHADDYVYGFYPYGWRGREANGDIVFAVQTPCYGLLLNASKARIDRAGGFRTRLSAEDAGKELNETFLARLAPVSGQFSVRIGDVVYDAVAGASKPDALVIQRLGRYLANVEVRDVHFETQQGLSLPNVTAKIVLFAWPESARITLHVTSDSDLKDVSLVARYLPDGKRRTPFAWNPAPALQSIRLEEGEIWIESKTQDLAAGGSETVCMGLSASPISEGPETDIVVRATGIAPYTGDLAIAYDAIADWRQVLLGENSDIWTVERVRLELENPSGQPKRVHLVLSKRGGGFGITGMSPVLCGSDGAPLGLPIQISKNWHIKPPWFDGITVLDLAPHARHTLEFRLAYAQWGGVPAVSHAQLALEGWGTHQLWDQCAIGSFGESICYDPDVNLGRAMIDDVRPLMVWGMGVKEHTKWSWTHNVGGGDFLVLEQDGKRQFLGRQRTEYESQGPVLTTVRYVGETPDGAVQSSVTTQSWRSDDFVRGLYTLRYDVIKPISFSRLAFFQLGADRYNHNLFTEISRGDLSGLKETWRPPMGGKSYSRKGIAIEGEKPWFAVTGNRKNPPPITKEGDQGAWADRGVIIHRWSARVGGTDVPFPHYSIYGTDDGGIPSAVVELSPPPGVDELLPGDHVDAQVEMIVLPQRADDYYGPNEAFRTALREHGGAWPMVHREAVGTALRVHAGVGKVLSEWPVMVRAKHGRRAKFSVAGASGYVPVSIIGARANAPFEFVVTKNGRRLPVGEPSATDWWQTRYRPTTKEYEFTFTIPFDEKDAGMGETVLDWSLKE